MADHSKVLARNVRAILQREGLTQEQFAKLTGLARPEVSNIINEKFTNPTLRKLTDIAAAFKGVTVQWLLTDHGAPQPNDSAERSFQEIQKADEARAAIGEEVKKAISKAIEESGLRNMFKIAVGYRPKDPLEPGSDLVVAMDLALSLQPKEQAILLDFIINRPSLAETAPVKQQLLAAVATLDEVQAGILLNQIRSTTHAPAISKAADKPKKNS